MRTEEGSVEVVADARAIRVAGDAVVDEVVHGIRAAQARHGFALVQEVGRLVVDRFYGGDPNVLRARGPKDASLRRLAEHPDLPMSAATLYRTITTYEVVSRLGGISTWKHLEPSHVRAVLPLPDRLQERLLARADAQAWTVRRLEAEARKLRAHAKRGNAGRPPLPRFVKAINALRKLAEDGDALLGDLDAADTLDARQREALLRTVDALLAKCAVLQARLAAPD